jgi:glucosyl-dolichyl phosphate glucuronosyltransferase
VSEIVWTETMEASWQPSADDTRTLAYSIIVCTYNRAHLLRACFEAIVREMARTIEEGELILVDNASNDFTREVFSSLQSEVGGILRLKYCYEPELGLSIARNHGVTSALGDILVFVDDDAIVLEGWLQNCLAAFRNYPGADAVGGEVRPRASVPVPDWLVPPLTSLYSIFSLGGSKIRPFRGKALPVGANMAFRRLVFDVRQFSRELGRTGANLMSNEEGEIFLAIRQGGKDILYVPSMRVEHIIDPERLTEDWVMARSYFGGVSQARMQLGTRRFLFDIVINSAKVLWLLLSRPFVRSSLKWLVWRCRMRKAIGFFDEAFARLVRSFRRIAP